MGTVTVIGHDGSPWPPAALAALERAKLVVGSARALSGVDTGAEQIRLGPLAPALERILACTEDVAILASGDPGFFGIVRALRQAGVEPIVLPAVSSVAVAFARAGLSWDDAIVVSAHGRSPQRAVNVCRAHPKVAVLTAPGFGPAELQAALGETRRTLIVAQALGTPQEHVGREGPWRDPNVVLVLDPSATADDRPGWIAGTRPGPDRWALPESEFPHRDSMITKAEVRALVLARLGPRVGDLVWDIGSGSGSVAVECARFGAAVIAVDRDPTAPVTRTGVPVVIGRAPECLGALPDPDAVFVGGGGLGVLKACALRRPARLVIALAALERAGPALEMIRDAGYEAEGVQLQASRFSALPDGAHRLAATNPVYVLSGWRPS